MKRLAIIPARGGSKRIPGKNIKEFHGKPIIAYSIQAAKASNLFDIVMVSTDSKEIAQIAEKFGAEVPFVRSDENANDVATTFDVIEEVLRSYKELGQSFDQVCCIYPTAVFISGAGLRKSFESFSKNEFDSFFPVIKYGYPIQRSLKLSSDSGLMKMAYPEHLNSTSQSLEPHYHDAGQYYWLSTDSILSKGKLWTDNSGIFEIDEMEGHDIDNPVDWKIAELKFAIMKELI